MTAQAASEAELKHRSEVADARLGVAEELGWPVAILGGSAAYLQCHSWLLALGAGVVLYLLAVIKYRREMG